MSNNVVSRSRHMVICGLLIACVMSLNGCTPQVSVSEPTSATFENIMITGNLQLNHPIVCTNCVNSTNITNGTIGLVDLAGQNCGAGNTIQGWTGSSLHCTKASGSGGTLGWSLAGNAGTDSNTQFLGTTDEKALEIRVGNLRAWRAEPNDTSPNLLGGFSGNTVTPGVVGATVSGGGQIASTHRVTGDFGTIGGGASNTANTYATVSGGASNAASGASSMVGGGSANTASSSYATVSGGTSNTSSAIGSTVSGGLKNTAGNAEATVGGGLNNAASGPKATVGGGESNAASGQWSAVPGGFLNTAAGDYAFAAGFRAKANHTGAFVWSDSTNADFGSTAVDQFAVRASGGTRIFSNSTATVGVLLAPGGNSWSALSDRHLKENFTSVDGQQMLARLSLIHISQWNLKSQDPSIKHIGPTAQDFYVAFGLGESNQYISSSDADGIALLSIQALYELLQQKDEQVQQLTNDVHELRQRLEELEQLVKE